MITDTDNILRLVRSRATPEDVRGDIALAILERAISDANTVGLIEGVGNGTKNAAGVSYGAKEADVIRFEARSWLTGNDCRPTLRAVGIRHGWLNSVLVDHTEWAHRFHEAEAA